MVIVLFNKNNRIYKMTDTTNRIFEKLAIENDKKSQLIEDVVELCKTQQRMIDNNSESISLLRTIVSANEIALNNAEKDFRTSMKLLDNLQDQIDVLASNQSKMDK